MTQPILRIVQADGSELKFRSGDRRILAFRAEEMRAAGMVGARYYIDGEELLCSQEGTTAGLTDEPEEDTHHVPEADIIDAEVVEAAEPEDLTPPPSLAPAPPPTAGPAPPPTAAQTPPPTAAQTPPTAAPAPPPTAAQTPPPTAAQTPPTAAPAPPPTAAPAAKRNDYQDAKNSVELANQILQNSALVAERMLGAAAKRSSEQAAEMARLQTQQVRDSLEVGAALQVFVGKMNAELAEERLAAFQIRRREDEIKERESQRRYDEARALHDANRPSTGIVLVEIASHFAANFARNAAQNYSVMNDVRPPTKKD